MVQDLKPSNLLMDEREQLVIADFGLAAILNATVAATAQSTTVGGGGTPAYKAPEQYSPDDFGQVSPKTDMWSFGCVVVELLTGFAPWRGKQPMEIMMCVAGKRQAPPVPSEARGALAGLLRQCFSIEQGARPTAGQALLTLRPEEGVPAAASFEPEPDPEDLKPTLMTICKPSGSSKHKRWFWTDAATCTVAWAKKPNVGGEGPFVMMGVEERENGMLALRTAEEKTR